jgi:hypothetical protein
MRKFSRCFSIGVLAAFVGASAGKSEEQAVSSASTASAKTRERKVKSLIKSYLNASNCRDRLAYITSPEENREALFRHYADKKTCREKFQSIDASECTQPVDNRCAAKVVFGKSRGNGGQEMEDWKRYYVVLGSSPRIDWRCSVGYNPLPLMTFRAMYEQDKPARFRVFAELTDYYNFEFTNANKKMYSARLNDKDGVAIAGYVEKQSELGQALFELLKDGKPHPVVLELTYGKESQNSSVVTITNMFGYRWREYPEELQ